MKSTKSISDMYDVKEIEQSSKRIFWNRLLLTLLYTVLFIFSIISLILWNHLISVFILSLIGILLFSFLSCNKMKLLKRTSCFRVHGKIVDLFYDVRHVNVMKTTSYSIVRKPHSSYWKRENRLRISVSEDGQIKLLEINQVTEKQAEYYNQGDTVLRIPNTRFPVSAKYVGGRWLCPICGEFNPVEEKSCDFCKQIIVF